MLMKRIIRGTLSSSFTHSSTFAFNFFTCRSRKRCRDHFLYSPFHSYYSSSPKSQLTSNTINHRVCLNNVDNLDDALHLFDKMLLMRPIPSVFDFTKLLGIITKMKHYESVILLFKKLCFLGLPINHFTMTIAINCYSHLKLPGFAFSIFASFFKRGCAPTLHTFSSLIHGLILADKTPQAVSLFRKLIREKVCKPNEVMFTTIINGYCKGKRMDEAMHLFHLMQSKGVKPSVITFSTLIDSLYRMGKCAAAVEFFNEMQARGIMPNMYTYRILLDGLCNNHKIAEALSLLHALGNRGLDSDIALYSIIIDGTSKHGYFNTASAFFDCLVSKGLAPDVQTYNILIISLCLNGQFKEAKECLMKMGEDGCLPNSVTYNVIVQGFLKGDRGEEAVLLLEEMVERGFRPDASTFELIIRQNSTLIEMIQKFAPKDLRRLLAGQEANTGR